MPDPVDLNIPWFLAMMLEYGFNPDAGGSVGASGVFQMADGSGGFQQPTDQNGDNIFSFAGGNLTITAAGFISLLAKDGGGIVINGNGQAVALQREFGMGDTNLGNTANKVNMKAQTLNLANVQTFANNAAAVAGGLVAGDVYKNGADPDLLCIVD